MRLSSMSGERQPRLEEFEFLQDCARANTPARNSSPVSPARYEDVMFWTLL